MGAIAEYLVRQLWNAGIRRIYGLPGGENVELLEAVRERGINFILVKNESSACFMAASEARLTGKIGAALTTLGPGATNATAGLAHAWLDRAPIVLITAAGDAELADRHTHQVLDLSALFAPICKLSAELRPDNAAEIINRALALTKDGRPGPVHLSIHNSVAHKRIELDSETSTPTSSGTKAQFAMGACSALLADKRRPVIVCGLGLEPERPYDQLREAAEALGAPVIDTPKSKGALSAAHPLYAGTIGLTHSDPAYALLEDADSIIAVGFDVVELVKPWDQPQPTIWIANWENRDPRIPCQLEYAGSIGAALSAIARLDRSPQLGWGQQRVAAFRQQQSQRTLPRPRSGRILPQTVLETLWDAAPEDVIVTTDVGSHKILAALKWPARRPNHYLVSNGLSAMGFGLTSAIAAAVATGQPTVCITGDAGFAMVMGELALLKALDLPVIVVVMNDAALDLIRSAQHKRQRPVYGTEFDNPDFALIARAYGLEYRKVDCRASCEAALNDGFKSGAPMLVDAWIDPIGYPTTVIQS